MKRLLPALSLLLTAAAAAQTLPATQPAYPAWAMKYYSDEICRLAGFGHSTQAMQLGLATLQKLEQDKAPAYQRAKTMASVCLLYRDEYKLKSAATFLEQADKLLTDQPKDRDNDLARADLLNVHAALLNSENNVDESARVCEQVLAIHRQYKDDTVADLQVWLKEIRIFRSTGPDEDTLDTINAYIVDLQKKIPGDSGQLVRALESKAVLFNVTHDYVSALQSVDDQEACASKVYGATSLQVAVASGDRAVTLYRFGKFAEALASLEKSKLLISDLLGKSHPRLVSINRLIAQTQMSLGDTELAEAAYKEATRIADLNVDEDPFHAALAYDALAKYYRSGNQDEQATAAETRAAAIREKYKIPPAKN